jgi:hypothetical protein
VVSVFAGLRVVLGAVTVVNRDGAAAQRLARTEVAEYLAGGGGPRHGLEPR